MKKEMTSMERVITALSHKEPDRVPLMLLLSLYGAKELQMPVKDYFYSSENVVKAQLLMKKKYRNDCYYTFSYAPVEIEAFGGEVIFMEEGPPNTGEPFIKDINEISKLQVPKIEECECLMKVLKTTEILKEHAGNETPIIGVVMSPFSIPVMQMGFEKYIELLYSRRDLFDALMRKNMEFCKNWANAQLKAGATAICYFDPLASPTIIEKETYMKHGFPVACSTIQGINGPTATHLASGITLPIIENIIDTKTAIIGISQKDDLTALKSISKSRIALLGNLNGIGMVNWSKEETELNVKKIIREVGIGGGLLLSDCHGEIPWQVPESVLMETSEALRKWGSYPLVWAEENGKNA